MNVLLGSIFPAHQVLLRANARPWRNRQIGLFSVYTLWLTGANYRGHWCASFVRWSESDAGWASKRSGAQIFVDKKRLLCLE